MPKPKDPWAAIEKQVEAEAPAIWAALELGPTRRLYAPGTAPDAEPAEAPPRRPPAPKPRPRPQALSHLQGKAAPSPVGADATVSARLNAREAAEHSDASTPAPGHGNPMGRSIMCYAVDGPRPLNRLWHDLLAANEADAPGERLTDEELSARVASLLPRNAPRSKNQTEPRRWRRAFNEGRLPCQAGQAPATPSHRYVLRGGNIYLASPWGKALARLAPARTREKAPPPRLDADEL